MTTILLALALALLILMSGTSLVRLPIKRDHRFTATSCCQGHTAGYLRTADSEWIAMLFETVKANNMVKEDKLTVDSLVGALEEWKHALEVGILPTSEISAVWPVEPLASKLRGTILELGIPILTMKHKELIPAVIKSIVKLSLEFSARLKEAEHVWESDKNSNPSDHASYDDFDKDNYVSEGGKGLSQDLDMQMNLASQLALTWTREWAPPASALGVLDSVFGQSHGVMDFSSQDLSGGGGGGAGGFGIFDGIWQNVGWTVMKELHTEVRDMAELRDLMKVLGKRSSIEGKELKKTPPRKDGKYPGVLRSKQLPNEVTGTKRSSAIEGILPQEAMLLILPKRNGSSIAGNLSNEVRKKLRLLFLSKLVESQLSSYEISSYDDILSTPKKKPWKYFEKMPVQAGGPIIVCLDTSWSMAGHRERLAKTVVLECATLAAKQGRHIYVLAFSGAKDLKECEIDLSITRTGITNLLRFLEQSFRGGTDVTAPLLRAIELIESSEEYASADILLVSDGELQTPPVSQHIIDKIKKLEKDLSVEVHGLLVGKNSSIPLSMLCTDWDGRHRLHTFLNKYDLANVLRQADSITPQFIPNAIGKRQSKARLPTKLYSWVADYTEGMGDTFKDELRSIFDYAQKQIDDMKAALNDSINIRSPPSNDRRKVKLERVIENLGTNLIERDEEIRLVLFATICREHLLLLGPPGTGKTELGKRLAAISHGKLFERLLTKYTTPEELFGPLSLSQLENDKYVRVIKGYLPDAQIAFLDEIFKANSAILNSLLTILNERKFDNGDTRVEIPLMTVVGASNELPDSEELEALYDRFLFRKTVHAVSDGAVSQLLNLPRNVISSSNLMSDVIFDPAIIASCLEDAKHIIIPDYVKNFLRDCRKFLRDEAEPAIYFSDRRLLKTIQILTVSAASNDRNTISVFDLLLLKHILWHSPDDQEVINQWLWENLIPRTDLKGFQFLVHSIKDRIVSYFRELESSDKDEGSMIELFSELEILSKVIESKISELERIRLELCLDEKVKNNIWLSDTDSIALRQRLLQNVEVSSTEMLNLYWLLSCFNKILRMTELSITFSETIILSCWDEFEAKRNLSTKFPSEIDIAYANATSNKLSVADMNMSKKEAQSKLSAADFKLWKKAQRALKATSKQQFVDDDNDSQIGDIY